jgi:hypothetical protein
MENPEDYDIDTNLGNAIDEGEKTGTQERRRSSHVSKETVSVPGSQSRVCGILRGLNVVVGAEFYMADKGSFRRLSRYYTYHPLVTEVVVYCR